MNPRTQTSIPRFYQDFEPSSKLVQEKGSDTLIVNLPGFNRDQIRVQIDGYGVLNLMGERLIGGNKWSRFRKNFPVDANCNINEIQAEFDDGVLQIIMPKLITEVENQEQAIPTIVDPPSQKPATEPKPTPTPQAPPSQKPKTRQTQQDSSSQKSATEPKPTPTPTPQVPESQKPDTEPKPTPTLQAPPSQYPKSTPTPQSPPSQKTATKPTSTPMPQEPPSQKSKTKPAPQDSQKLATESKPKPTPQAPLSQEPITELKPTPIPQLLPSQKLESELKSDKAQYDTNENGRPISSVQEQTDPLNIKSENEIISAPKTIEEDKKIWSTGSSEGSKITNKKRKKHDKNKGSIDATKMKDELSENLIHSSGGGIIEDYMMESRENRHLVVNMVVALLVVVALMVYVIYTIWSPGKN